MQNVIKQAFTETPASGTELTIDNTIEARMEMKLNGNTKQEGTPTPDTPIPVNVVTGDNTIYINNKNLFDGVVAQGGFDSSGGINSGNQDRKYSVNYIKVLPNTSYVANLQFNRVVFYDINKNFISRSTSYNFYSFTTLSNAYYIRFDMRSASDTRTLQLEKGTTATSYVPHQEQTYPINLGSMELCKIGDYQDYLYKENGKWYKYGAIGKVVLNGSESWQQSGFTNDTIYSVYSGAIKNYSYGQAISDLFIWNYNVSSTTITEYISTGGATFRIGVLKSRLSAYTINEFKTWLSNNNVTTYYVLVTPTTTEITDTTLINQLDEISQALSQKGTTIISQNNDDLLFNLDVIALTK